MNTSDYYSIGIDAHKRFCQVHVLHPNGETVWKGRINSDGYDTFADIAAKCGGPCKATFESSSNWHVLYDRLTVIENIDEVIMAHPLKVKLICDAHLKNDKVDALHLAQLLRLGMIPPAHATGPEGRYVKELIRQRAVWVGMRTRVRNRTHRLLGACPDQVSLPQCTDLFGTRGMKAMRALQLPEPHQLHLTQNLATLAELKAKTDVLEKELQHLCREKPEIKLLATMPGVGKVIACVISSEIDGIGRFPEKNHFIAYCGLVPGTHGSAGVFHQGRMIKACNKWLKWAFIEAAWVAISNDAYFGEAFKAHRARGKKPNTSITIIARRMAQIAWSILRENRGYRPGPASFPARS